MAETLKQLLVRYKVIIKFLFAGGSATLVQLIALYLFTDVFGIWYVGSAVLAFIVAVLISFSSHKWWTFRDFHWGAVNRQFLLYLTIQIFNLIVNIALIYVLVEILDIWYLLSQALISLVLAAMSFLIYKHKIFVYSEHRFEKQNVKQ